MGKIEGRMGEKSHSLADIFVKESDLDSKSVSIAVKKAKCQENKETAFLSG